MKGHVLVRLGVGGSTRDFCWLEELFELGSDGYKSTAVVFGIYFH